MYVGNCTDEDVQYEIGNPGGGAKFCGKGKFKLDNINYNSEITFVPPNTIERPYRQLALQPNDQILVLLHKFDGVYFITSLVLE
jgi:hypothetical protein